MIIAQPAILRTPFYLFVSRCRRAIASVLLAASLLLTAGCPPIQESLEQQAAKNWCLSIRANQVIPVYPLTEDLMPGDTFLAHRSIDDQVADYEQNGFLPLDDHRHRFNLIEYKDLYFDGYWKDAFGAVPHDRPDRRPDAGPVPATGPASITLTDIPAPRAAFPSYSFSITRGQGLSLAVPVHAVPIAFNYMGADSATGTITLLDSHTYAADSYDLEYKLRS